MERKNFSRLGGLPVVDYFQLETIRRSQTFHLASKIPNLTAIVIENFASI